MGRMLAEGMASVNARKMWLSNLFRNVPFLTSLEMSLFLLICCWGVRRSEALRRGLCGAFRAKRRRTPQRVLTLVIDSTSATPFSAHSLAARDDPHISYFLAGWLARGAAHLARPGLLEVERPDLRTRCVLRDGELLPLHQATHRPRDGLASAQS